MICIYCNHFDHVKAVGVAGEKEEIFHYKFWEIFGNERLLLSHGFYSIRTAVGEKVERFHNRKLLHRFPAITPMVKGFQLECNVSILEMAHKGRKSDYFNIVKVYVVVKSVEKSILVQ